MQFYLTIGEIQRQIDHAHETLHTAPEFGSILKSVYQSGQFLTSEPSLPDLSHLRRGDDKDFFQGINQLCFAFSREMLFFKGEYDFVSPGRSLAVVKEFFGTRAFSHTHDCYEIDYILNGSCEFHFENEKILLNRGDCYFISPYAEHSLRLCSRDSCVLPVMVKQKTFQTTFFALLESENVLAKFFKSTLLGRTEENYLLFHTNDAFETRQAMKELFLSEFQHDQYSGQSSIYWLNLFFISILRNYTDFSTFASYDSESDFTAVLNYIQKNYHALTISALAEKFSYSPSYLSKQIRRFTGETFSSLIRTLKMAEARSLLLDTNLSIETIAERTGYNSADHFTRVFKGVFGIPTQKYRKLNNR